MSNFDFSGLEYDPITGVICRKSDPGQPVGTINKGGYLVFRHQGRLVYAHRVAFAIHFGELPALVDHINGIKADNRACNLRAASASLNSQNREALGITKPGHTKRWAAAITVNRKRKHLGYFDTPEEAHAAYLAAKTIHHPTAIRSVAS